jgi:hypothetical protein
MPEGTERLLLKTPHDAIEEDSILKRIETKSPFLDETLMSPSQYSAYGGVLIAYGFNGGVAASGV